jgi:hypothetical protein
MYIHIYIYIYIPSPRLELLWASAENRRSLHSIVDDALELAQNSRCPIWLMLTLVTDNIRKETVCTHPADLTMHSSYHSLLFSAGYINMLAPCVQCHTKRPNTFPLVIYKFLVYYANKQRSMRVIKKPCLAYTTLKGQ